jgi:hypothetical protein
MREVKEMWHLRLPDGRVVKAAATSVRRHQAAGRLPEGTEARKASSDRWLPLTSHPELSDKNGSGGDTGSWNDINLEQPGKPASVASRMDAAQLRQPGLRGLMEELHAALDNTLTSRKLVAAASAALAGGALATGMLLAGNVWVTAGCLAGIALLALGLMALLTRMAFHEVSRLRPSRIRDGWEGFSPLLAKLLATWGVGITALTLASWGLRHLPHYLAASLPEEAWAPWAVAGAAYLAGVAECLLWPLLVFLGPLAPIWVVEDCTFLQGIRQGVKMIAPIRWRFFVAQWMALSLAGVAALPLGWVVGQSPAGLPLAWAAAGALVLAYYSVANVLLYLHIRYEER